MKIQGVTGGMPVSSFNDNIQEQNDALVVQQPLKQSFSLDNLFHKGEEVNDIDNIEKAVQQINKTMETYNTEVRFSLHEKSGEYYVKVVNPIDNTVIREIPPEKVLNMVAYFKELLGIVVDKFI